MHSWAILVLPPGIDCDCLLLSASHVVGPVELGVGDGNWMRGGRVPHFSWSIPNFREVLWAWALGRGLSQHYCPSIPSPHHSSQTLSGRVFFPFSSSYRCLLGISTGFGAQVSSLPVRPRGAESFCFYLSRKVLDLWLCHGTRGFCALIPHSNLKHLLHIRDGLGKCCPKCQLVTSWHLYRCPHSSPLPSVVFKIVLLWLVRWYGSFSCLGSPVILNCHANSHAVFENS